MSLQLKVLPTLDPDEVFGADMKLPEENLLYTKVMNAGCEHDLGAADPNIQVVSAGRPHVLSRAPNAQRGAAALHRATKELVATHIAQLWRHNTTLEEAAN